MRTGPGTMSAAGMLQEECVYCILCVSTLQHWTHGGSSGIGMSSGIVSHQSWRVGVTGDVLSQVGHRVDAKGSAAPAAEAMPDRSMPSGSAAAEALQGGAFQATGPAAYQALLDAALQSRGCGHCAGAAGHSAAEGAPAGAGAPLQRQGSRKRKHSCQHTEPAHADGCTTRSASAEVQH